MLTWQILAELLKGNERCIIGILSSHPATILATLRACGKELEDFSFDIARAFAAEVMASCPVDYVRWAKSVGQIFEGNAPEVVSCSANTYFFVDHAKPTQVLAAVKESHGVWTFGDLPEGHEFLALMDVGPDKGRLAYYDSDAIDGYWEEIRRLARQCTGIRYTAAMRNSS